MLLLLTIFVSFQHYCRHTFHHSHNHVHCDCKVPRASRSEIRKKAKRQKGREREWGGFEAGGEGEGGRQSLNVNREKSTSLIPRSCKILWKSPEFLYGVKLLTRGEGWFEILSIRGRLGKEHVSSLLSGQVTRDPIVSSQVRETTRGKKRYYVGKIRKRRGPPTTRSRGPEGISYFDQDWMKI